MMKATTVRIGRVLHVFVGGKGDAEQLAEYIAKLRASIKPNGPAIHLPDGTEEWIGDEQIVDTSKSASEMYEWDRTGNKVRANRFRYTKTPAGEVTKQLICYVWVKFTD